MKHIVLLAIAAVAAAPATARTLVVDRLNSSSAWQTCWQTQNFRLRTPSEPGMRMRASYTCVSSPSLSTTNCLVRTAQYSPAMPGFIYDLVALDCTGVDAVANPDRVFQNGYEQRR